MTVLNMDFVLKEKDALAPLAIAEWIKQALEFNTRAWNSIRKGEDIQLIPYKKISKASAHLAIMLNKQQKARRLPD